MGSVLESNIVELTCFILSRNQCSKLGTFPMDWALAGALILLGVSLGSSILGGSPAKVEPQPCVCKCECSGDTSPSYLGGFQGVVIAFLIFCLCALAGIVWFLIHSQPVFEAKGKGKKGVLGVQAALTLK